MSSLEQIRTRDGPGRARRDETGRDGTDGRTGRDGRNGTDGTDGADNSSKTTRRQPGRPPQDRGERLSSDWGGGHGKNGGHFLGSDLG